MCPCKLSPFLSSLGPAAGTPPHSCLGRSDKAEVPDLGILPQKHKERRRKGKGCGAGLSLHLCSSLGGLCMQGQANTTILWTPALGKQRSWRKLPLEVLFRSFAFSCSWRAASSEMQGEGWCRSCFWAVLWGSCASPVLLCTLAAQMPKQPCPQGCDGVWGLFLSCSPPKWSSAHLSEASDSIQRASAEGRPLRRRSPFVWLSWQDVWTEGSINIKGAFSRIQTVISSYQLVKPGDKPNSLVLTAIIIWHLLCSLCSL